LRQAAILPSISSHSRDTWRFEMPLIPIAGTKASTERVDTPWMEASWMTAVSAPELVEGLGQSPRLEKPRQIAAAAQLGGTPLDGAGAGLPTRSRSPLR